MDKENFKIFDETNIAVLIELVETMYQTLVYKIKEVKYMPFSFYSIEEDKGTEMSKYGSIPNPAYLNSEENYFRSDFKKFKIFKNVRLQKLNKYYSVLADSYDRLSDLLTTRYIFKRTDNKEVVYEFDSFTVIFKTQERSEIEGKVLIGLESEIFFSKLIFEKWKDTIKLNSLVKNIFFLYQRLY